MRRNLRSIVASALITGLVGGALFLSPWGETLETAVGLHWLFQVRGSRPPPPGVLIVSLDKASSAALGVRYEPRDWPRTLHARLIEGLHRAGVHAVVFDLFFREAHPAEDAVLVAAMRAAGNVLLLELLEKCEVRLTAAEPAGEGTALDHVARCEAARPGPRRSGLDVAVHRLLTPCAAIAEAAAATAPFTLPDASGSVLQFWTLDGNAGDAPSLPLMTLLVAYRSHQARLEVPEQHSAEALAPPGPSAHEPLARSQSPALDPVPLTIASAPSEWAALAAEAGVHVRNPFGSGLVQAIQAPTSRYLNFYGPPWSVRTISYTEALSALEQGSSALAPEHDWKDAVVFVGVSSPVQWEQRDDFRTPFSDPETGHDLSGVEILATAFANLRDGTCLRQLAPWAALGLLLGWGFLIAVTGFVPRFGLAALGVLGLAGAYFLVCVFLFGAHQLWLPMAIPLLAQTPLLLGLSGVSRYRALNRDRQRIREVFSYYLPEPVVERLVREGRHPASDHEELFGVCLYSDMESYTTLAEGMPPSQLAETMNAYYQLLFEPVRRHGGIVCDVVGDAMVAIWPARQDDSAVREAACRAALEIQAALDARAEQGVALPTRIGLHAGVMAMAHLGAGDHYAYRAVGDIVNVAARLEALSKELGTRLLASGDVLQGLGTIVARPLGSFVLRGRRATVNVYELVTRRVTGNLAGC